MTAARQGQSQATKAKQEALAYFISAHSKVVRVIQEKHPWAGPYCYIETNAGCGWNHKVDIPGSPLVALRAFASHPTLRVESLFIEKNKESALQLAYAVEANGGCKSMVVTADHCVALPMIAIPPKSYGLVYADPNALVDSPEEALHTFFLRPETKKIDVLINLDGHMRRRVIAAQRAGNPGNYDDLRRLMRRVGKKHWWIRQPHNCPGSKWTFLFGSNFPKINIQGLGKVDLPMFPVESEKGQKILVDLMGEHLPGKTSSSHSPYRTYQEYLRHPRFMAVRQLVLNRNGGLCELCNSFEATEVHHRVYPQWGTFDDPAALVSICHPCHCYVHGVSR